MKVERSIAAPLRSARQTTDELANFVGEVLTARSFPSAAKVNAQIKRLAPLLSLLLAKRILGTPALRLGTEDMEILVNVGYEIDAAHDLSIPALSLLGDLDPAADISITLFATEEVPAGLRALVISTSGAPARLTLVVQAAPQPAGQEPDSAPEKDSAQEKDSVPEQDSVQAQEADEEQEAKVDAL